MKITKRVINLIENHDANFEFTEAEECPICHAKIVGKYLSSVIWEKNNNYYAAVTNYCSGCRDVFINYYAAEYDSYKSTYEEISLISSAPNHFEKRTFEDNLKAISPNFDIIYNQAKQAETMNLDQIAGIGYRKSIEFLVKDYAIKYNPQDEDKIKKMLLSNCINEYIDDSRIKNLAEKSVWLGNDETHYVRKHEDRDITDMKKFIEALVYFISMVLITEDAESMQKLNY